MIFVENDNTADPIEKANKRQSKAKCSEFVETIQVILKQSEKQERK
jgi:hypothetical protein